MMAMSWDAAEAEFERAREARLHKAVGQVLAESDRLRRERERLAAKSVQLTEEVSRLKAENEDLRASAELWIWLYENQLDRANQAIRKLDPYTSD
jgi:chromosome segregation ATPase